MIKIMISIVRFYKVVSTAFRQYQFPLFFYSDCKFQPTCSDYAIQAILTHGAVKGSVMSLNRILRCNPWSKGGIDNLKL